jgi:hypothetical protein
MAWVTSLLADYAGLVDPAWLRPPLTIEEFFAPFVRTAEIHGQPQIRAEYEVTIAADLKLIEAIMQPGDVLPRWWLGHYGVGRVGVAILRGDQVVRAWKTAALV